MRSFSQDYLQALGKTGVLSRPEFTDIGITHMYAGDTVPDGYLLCDGAAYNSIALPHLADLYAVIGNKFGGSDGTDFQVPDLRGIVVKGTGASTTHSKANGSAFDGDVIGTYQQDEIQSHYQSDNLNWVNSWNAGHPWRVWQNMYTGGILTPWRMTSLLWTGEGDFIKSGGVNQPTEHSGYGSPRLDTETKPATISLNYIIKW